MEAINKDLESTESPISTEAPVEAEKPIESAVETAASEAPEYTPNLKFKVLDKEMEFDPLLKDLVKSKEVEDKFREFHEKSFGIESIKQDRARIRDEFNQFKATQFEPVVKELQQVGRFIQEGDYDKVFSKLGIPEEKLEQWLIERIQYKQLPPDQRARVDAQRQAKDQVYQTQTEAEQLREALEQERTSNLQFQLDQTLAHPQVMDAASQFDARAGKQGAFLDEVLKRGDYYFQTTGRVVPPNRIVSEVMNLIGFNAQQPAQGQQPGEAPPPMERPVASVTPTEKPVVKSFNAKPTAPVKKVMTSIDDLKKLQQQMASANR